MNCFDHPEIENAAFCIRCGHALCSTCVRNVRGSVYCESCLAAFVDTNPGNGDAAARKKVMVGGDSPGAAFALGLIPGVGAIYNAEYFKAAVHILIFGLLVSIVDHGGGLFEPLFGLLAFGFYVYMPFEAYYTAKKRKLLREGINLETPFDRFNERLDAVQNKE